MKVEIDLNMLTKEQLVSLVEQMGRNQKPERVDFTEVLSGRRVGNYGFPQKPTPQRRKPRHTGYHCFRWTKDEVHRIMELWNMGQGYTEIQIARMVHRPESSTYNLIHYPHKLKNSLTVRAPNTNAGKKIRRMTAGQREQLEKEIRMGNSNSKIAKLFGCHESRVCQIKSKMGLTGHKSNGKGKQESSPELTQVGDVKIPTHWNFMK